jgi:hypothetical protein
MVSELGFNLFVRPDGRKYIGLWKDGHQHGKGVFISKNGIRREGDWS